MSKQRNRKRQLLPTTAEEAIAEAKKYFDNATEILKKTRIEYGAYKEPKYVKEAAAMGYLATLRAIDSYLLGRGMRAQELPTSIEEYTKALRKIPHNGKLMTALAIVYQNLHIFAYYRSGVGIEMVKEGFKRAKEIIDTFSRLNKIKKQK